MKTNTIIYVILGCCVITACGPSTLGSYPSYERTLEQYAPQGRPNGVKLTDPKATPASDTCDCPRVWYRDHWVYYYHGSWIYWHHGFWYYYPYFHWYYFGYGPVFYTGPDRIIVSRPPSETRPARIRPTVIDADDAHTNPRVQPVVTDPVPTRPTRVRPAPTPPPQRRIRPVSPPPSPQRVRPPERNPSSGGSGRRKPS
ncbi:MAG: hypothetical protein QNJ97_12335 [Myxococcota bacterium]|nr:hypothetical protein [Myxococcota bacterium]